jgi:hypothetical protein
VLTPVGGDVAMKPYTFYFFEFGHPMPNFDFVWCDGDGEAAAQAQSHMARYPETQAVEIFDGQNWRVRLSR